MKLDHPVFPVPPFKCEHGAAMGRGEEGGGGGGGGGSYVICSGTSNLATSPQRTK